MKRFLYGLVAMLIVVASTSPAVSGQTATAPKLATSTPGTVAEPLVEFEMMTWVEVKQALQAGKTTALIYTGGTEQRGPHNVTGGHNLMGRETVKAIALELGNAIAMPVLPFTPNNASAQLPGTIGLTNELLAAVLERLAEQVIVTGFKNVILMGDHGGGQPDTYREVARKLDATHGPQGIHVYYCDEVYSKANDEFNAYLVSKGHPPSGHGAIPDTSAMLYLGGDKNWVRKELLATAVGDPVRAPGERGRGPRDPAEPAPPRTNNGITGDARPSTAALGKMQFDLKVEYAVKQIRRLLDSRP